MLYKLPTQFPFRFVTQGSRVVGILYTHNSLYSDLLELYHQDKLAKKDLLELFKKFDNSSIERSSTALHFLTLACFKKKKNEDYTWLSFSSDILDECFLPQLCTISQKSLRAMMDNEATLYYDAVRVVVATESIIEKIQEMLIVPAMFQEILDAKKTKQLEGVLV